MEKGYITITQEPNIRDNGLMTRSTATESLNMPTVIGMKATGGMRKDQIMEFMNTPMGMSTMASGKTT